MHFDILNSKNKNEMSEGDVIIALPSSGVHSNGFSLVRKVFTMSEQNLSRYCDELGRTLGEALIEPTRIYVKALKAVKNAGVVVKGCSHITGGGFYENIPRMLPDNITAKVVKNSYEVPAIFNMLQKTGNIEEQMMYNTFNMGVGMVLAVSPEDADATVKAVNAAGNSAFILGEAVAGDKGVILC